MGSQKGSDAWLADMLETSNSLKRLSVKNSPRASNPLEFASRFKRLGKHLEDTGSNKVLGSIAAAKQAKLEAAQRRKHLEDVASEIVRAFRAAEPKQQEIIMRTCLGDVKHSKMYSKQEFREIRRILREKLL